MWKPLSSHFSCLASHCIVFSFIAPEYFENPFLEFLSSPSIFSKFILKLLSALPTDPSLRGLSEFVLAFNAFLMSCLRMGSSYSFHVRMLDGGDPMSVS